MTVQMTNTQDEAWLREAEEVCPINDDTMGKYQRTLYKHLEALCEDNGVSVWKQWDVSGKSEKIQDDGHCLCGHWIHDAYDIVNVFNGNVATPIGSVCIQRWFNGNNIQENLKKLVRGEKLKKEGKYACVVEGCKCSSKDKQWPVCSRHLRQVNYVFSKYLRCGKYKGMSWLEMWSKNNWYCVGNVDKEWMQKDYLRYVRAWIKAMIAKHTIEL